MSERQAAKGCDTQRPAAPPPVARQGWACPDGLNSAASEFTVSGDLPDSVGSEEKKYIWIAPGCCILTGRRIIRHSVRLNVLFPTGEPSLGVHIPVGGQIEASLAGAGGIRESESRYGLNWIRRNEADCSYDYVPGTYRTFLFGYSESYLRRTLGGIRLPRQLEGFLSGKGHDAITGVNASALIRAIPALVGTNPYDGDVSRLFLQGQVFTLMAGVLSDLDERCDDDRTQSDRTRAKVRAVCDRLLDELGNLPALEDLAATVGLSQRQLARAFRAVTGRSILEWVVARRLDLAASLLMDGGLPIKEISHRAGYAHVPSFTAAFTKQFAVPPAEYRRATVLRHFISSGGSGGAIATTAGSVSTTAAP
jgi:AraC-like DNA-binding protein